MLGLRLRGPHAGGGRGGLRMLGLRFRRPDAGAGRGGTPQNGVVCPLHLLWC